MGARIVTCWRFPTRPTAAGVCLAVSLLAGLPVRAQFVAKSGRQFMYQGNPITFYGSAFYPATFSPCCTAAWHSSAFPNYINQVLGLETNGGQNIMRPTDYWDQSTSGQTTNDPVLWSNMDYLVSTCRSNGLFVIMDLSAYKWLLYSQGYTNTVAGTSNTWVIATNWYGFIDFITAKYKNEPAIAFWSIVGEPASPSTAAQASALVAFYDGITTRLRSDDPNHLICAGGFNHMEDSPSLQWWQQIYSLPNNNVCAYKTYSQNDLNYTATITNYCKSIGKIMVNEEFGLPQYMGDDVWSGSNYNSIATSRATFFTNVYTLGLAGGAAGFQFWDIGEQVSSGSYEVAPDTSPASWATMQRFSPPPQPPLNLGAIAVGAGQNNLTWTRNAEVTVTGYNVYRSTTNGFRPGAGNRIASGVITNTYADTVLSSGVTYYYCVTAVNQLGHESAPSAQASSTGAPGILNEPMSLTLAAGQTALFTVTVGGNSPLYFQWQAGAISSGVYTNLSDGGQFSGSATTNLTIMSITSNNVADYVVVVTNAVGSVTSSVARLTLVTATNFTMSSQEASGQDWNTTGIWSPGGQAASVSAAGNPANTYEVLAAGRLRTPANTNNAIFPGGMLTIDGNGLLASNGGGGGSGIGELRLKAVEQGSPGTLTVPRLVMNGGQIDDASPGGVANTMVSNTINTAKTIINGEIAILSNTPIYGDNGGNGQITDRGMQINAWLTGNKTIQYTAYLTNFQPTFACAVLNIAGTSNTFSGPWDVKVGVLLGSASNSLGTNTITVETDGALETTYDINNPSASLVINGNGRVFLHQNDTFGKVTVNGLNMVSGTYSWSQLNGSYPVNFPASWTQQSGSSYSQASGSITVGLRLVSLMIQQTGTTLTLTWPRGTLLQASNLQGPWQTNGAASPFTLTPTNPLMFFRVQVQ